MRSTLAENLKLLMARGGIRSHAELASRTGLSKTQIGNILRCERGASVDSLERLADGLDCEPWQLLAPPMVTRESAELDVGHLVHSILELKTEDREAIWRLIYRLHVATRNSELF